MDRMHFSYSSLTYSSLWWYSKHFFFIRLQKNKYIIQSANLAFHIRTYDMIVGSNFSFPRTLDSTLVSSSISRSTKSAAKWDLFLALVIVGFVYI